MSMSVTVPMGKKEAIGKSLQEKGFIHPAQYFLEYSYFGSRDKITINIECEITPDFLDALDETAKEFDLRGLMTQARQLKALILEPETQKVKSLKGFGSGVAKYIQNKILNGWLYFYDETEVYKPMLVEGIDFRAAVNQDDRSSVTISAIYNCAKEGGLKTRQFQCFQEDVLGRTIPEILSDKFSLFKERQELRDNYDRAIALYQKYQPEHGVQFRVIGNIKAIAKGGFRGECLKISSGRRLVNNEEGISKSRRYGAVTKNSFWQKKGVTTDSVNEIPFHPMIYMFDLEEHENLWIYASAIKPYEYNPALKSKIVLPDAHSDLIDILVDDMDVVREDFVEGKSGGTIILCMGAPGLGKTLTAEIYSEVVSRPLYRVHSGQLGTSPDTIEKRLAEVLLRAERWGAILLLDEADIFIRTRSNDMDHNAIVASFLRRLEYYSGMLFMTTNREKDVDDAILSRCSAILKYEHPCEKQRLAIWSNLRDQFEMKVPDDVVAELVSEYPVISGRDIKDLLKLADKYNRVKGYALNLETFRHCAIFRGIEHRKPNV